MLQVVIEVPYGLVVASLLDNVFHVIPCSARKPVETVLANTDRPNVYGPCVQECFSSRLEAEYLGAEDSAAVSSSIVTGLVNVQLQTHGTKGCVHSVEPGFVQ